jgi:hypothetical protein
MKPPPFNPPSRPVPRGNGPQPDIEKEIADLARVAEREPVPQEVKHPALIACEKAAEMVREVHKSHEAEGETLAQHLEHIGETFASMCKEAANEVRKQRILPGEMASKMADELIEIGNLEFERQTRVARGLTAARDAILGIEQKRGPS